MFTNKRFMTTARVLGVAMVAGLTILSAMVLLSSTTTAVLSVLRKSPPSHAPTTPSQDFISTTATQVSTQHH